jgi:uncharacterized protein with PIN domain
LSDHKAILRYFSACPLCGHFLASLLAVVGEDKLKQAVEEQGGIWIELPWHASFEAMFTTYYDWHIEPNAQAFSSRCPACSRRIAYLVKRSETEGEMPKAVLQLERRPGLRA